MQRLHTEGSGEEQYATPAIGTASPAGSMASPTVGSQSANTAVNVEEAAEQCAAPPETEKQLQSLLDTYRTQSRRHALLGNATFMLACGFLFFGLCTVLMTLVALAWGGILPAISVDYSPFAWGIRTTYPEMTRGVTVSGVTPLLLLLIAMYYGGRVRRKRKQLVWELTQHDDVRVVGPLLEALYLRDATISNMVKPQLIRLLPQMRAEDAPSLSDNQRWMLRLYLGRSRRNLIGNSDALSLAILEAFAYVGDGTELPTIRRLAAGKGCIGANGEVQQAAQAYLEEIARRTAQENQAQTLLRGAQAGGSASRSLLRAATPSSSAPAGHLLRPLETLESRTEHE